jgi:TonB family protein
LVARSRPSTPPVPVHAAIAPEPAPRAAANAAAAQGDAEQACHLTLSSDPLEAQVEWGGNVIGQTPMLIDLLPGPQTFVLSRDGYFKATVVLYITDAMSGKSESRTVVMIPRKGRGAGGLAGARARESGLKGAFASSVATAPAAPDLPVPVPEPAAAADSPGSPSPPKPTPPSAFTNPDNLPVPVAPPPTAAAPPTVLPATPAVLAFGPEMTRPALLSGGELAYPREAMVAGVTGTIIAKCTITAEGALRSCRIIKGLPFLDKAALDMLATRRYSPVMYQGKAVPVEYVFNLKIAPPR